MPVALAFGRLVQRDRHEVEASVKLTVSFCQPWLCSKTLAQANKDLQPITSYGRWSRKIRSSKSTLTVGDPDFKNRQGLG